MSSASSRSTSADMATHRTPARAMPLQPSPKTLPRSRRQSASCLATMWARRWARANAIPYAGDNPTHLKHLVCLDYGPEMSVVSAQKQIGGMNRRPLGWRSIDEYVEMSMQANPRPSAEYYRTTAENGLRLNYAGKYVPKQDPDLFWINGSFGANEVPLLWEKWAQIQCPILELKGAESDFLSPEIVARMRELQPSMQFLEVPDSGHPVASDNPEFLVRELRRFLVD